MSDTIIAIAASLPIAVVISMLWANAISKTDRKFIDKCIEEDDIWKQD